MTSAWAASALSWWQEAGVDTLVAEAPRDWLEPRPKTPAKSAAPEAAALPETLEEFQQWLATADGLPFAAPNVARAAPAGDPGSGLMILIDMPSAAGELLGGEPGALFDRMLGAIGRSRDTVYLAALSPIRTPAGALDEASAASLAEIARHHIGLVAPRALLMFGDICGKALLGSAVAGARARWHEIPTRAGPIKALVTIRPDKLIEMPAWKKLAWDDLQMLMEELKP